MAESDSELTLIGDLTIRFDTLEARIKELEAA